MSWKDLSELAPQLTETEVRFEKRKRLVGLILGPLAFVLILLFPPLQNVSPMGMRSLAIFSLAAIWWITEAIPIPATTLFVLPLVVICGLLPYDRAFGYFSHWVNMFLLGAFIIGHATYLHGLTHRFSLSLVASRMVGGSSWRLLVMFLIANAVVSAFISNVVTTVLFLSMGLALLETLQIKPGSGYGLTMFLGVAWATNIGSQLTPSGSPPNMITIGMLQQAGFRIGYTQWVLGTLAFTILMMAAMFVVMRLFFSAEEANLRISQEAIVQQLRRLGPFSRGEKIAATAMGVAVLLWVLPDLGPLVLGRTHPVAVWLNTRLSWAVVSLAVAGSLFLAPVNWKERKFAMTWDEAVKSIELGTIFLVAGALAIGELVGDKKLGLGEFFAASISSIAGPQTSRYLFLLAVITFAMLLTNMVTNIAVTSSLVPIAIAVAPSMGLNPVALAVTVSLVGMMGLATPMASVPCAIIFASGYIRILPLLIRGLMLSLVGILILSVVGYPILNWVFPWDAPVN